MSKPVYISKTLFSFNDDIGEKNSPRNIISPERSGQCPSEVDFHIVAF